MNKRILIPVLAALTVLGPLCTLTASAAEAPDASASDTVSSGSDAPAASPQASEDYAKFMKANFYLLDDQKFSKLSCKIHAPIVDKALANARQQFHAVPGDIEIDENMKDFALVLDKTQGFSFTKPIFGFKALQPENIRDAQEFSEGTEKMKDGLRTMIDNVIDGIKGTFDIYSVKGDMKKILAFEKTAGGAEVTLENKGMTIKQTFANGGSTSTLSGADMTGTEASEFGTLGDRLLFTKSTAHFQQASGNMDVTVEVKYDKIGNVVVPTKILDTTVMVINGVNQDTKINIYLEGCTVE